MNRRTPWGMICAALIALSVAGCGGSGGKNVAVVTIAATTGTGQSATVNTAFAAPLVATVTTGGTPTSGVVVTFAAPATGASGTFAAGANTATTNASGVATSAIFSANGTAGGPYTVTATAPGATAPANFTLTNTAGAAAELTCTSGSGQSAAINTAFAAPLVAQVADSGGNPVNDPGVVVTYAAPATGASATFAGGAHTATTNASGAATSAVVSANGTVGGPYTVSASAAIAATQKACNFSLTNTSAAVIAIAATSGSGQSATINTAFAAPLVATVTTGGTPTSGVVVTFAAPATGASGTFAAGANTATTNASGVATSAVFSANGTAGGPYTVTATAPGATAPANFTLTNTNATASAFTGPYVYSLLGQDFNNGYALVGVVTINSSGTVTGGVQDYSDGAGITSPQPAGDTITGGTLTVNATTGQGKLTIVTNDTNVGVGGTETLGVQFVNNDHAQIIQFDSSATSSGSLDLQTQTTLPTGSFAFSFGGSDPADNDLAAGGVFRFSGNNTTGTIDLNDGGTVVTGTSFDQTFGSPDASTGRGSLTISTPAFAGASFNYYIVGPEVIRFIDVDAQGQVSVGSLDAGLGSAYGQGSSAGSFSAASLGQSTIALSGTGIFEPFVLLGQITAAGAGVVDADEAGAVIAGSAFTGGSFTVGSNGYGTLTIPAGDAEDVSNIGVYLIDPKLNPNDPNNPSSGTLSSALLVDLDNNANTISLGVLVPQADTSTSAFTGNYAFGGQINFPNFDEADFVGQGSVTSLALSGSSLFNDVFGDVTASDTQVTTATFTGTFAPDTVHVNAGRYTTTLIPTIVAGSPGSVIVAAYQASGTQLFWIEEDSGTLFMGQLQKQNLPQAAAVKAAAAQTKPKP